MSHATGTAGLAAALALDAERRAADYQAAAAGPGAWLQDYGPQRRRPDVDAARYSYGRSGNGDGDRRAERENRLVKPRHFSFKALWAEMMSYLCPGTKFFVVCVAITTFIVVV